MTIDMVAQGAVVVAERRDLTRNALYDAPFAISTASDKAGEQALASSDQKLIELKAEFANIVNALNPAIHEWNKRARERRKREREGDEQGNAESETEPSLTDSIDVRADRRIHDAGSSENRSSGSSNISTHKMGNLLPQHAPTHHGFTQNLQGIDNTSSPYQSFSATPNDLKDEMSHVLDPQLFLAMTSKGKTVGGDRRCSIHTEKEVVDQPCASSDMKPHGSSAARLQTAKGEFPTGLPRPQSTNVIRPPAPGKHLHQQQFLEGPIPNALAASVFMPSIAQTKRSKQGPGFMPHGLDLLRKRKERLRQIKQRRENPEKRTVEKGNGRSPGKTGGGSPGKTKGTRRKKRRS